MNEFDDLPDNIADDNIPMITSPDPTPEERSAHRKDVTGRRRRNNIFGELSDKIIISFLDIGGKGAFYDPTDRSFLYGYAEKLYVVYLAAAEKALPKILPENRQKLLVISRATGAIPLIAAVDEKMQRIKYFDINNKKAHYLK